MSPFKKFSLKKCLPALLLFIPALFSTNSFAFNMPKEFASLGTQTLSQPDVYTQRATFSASDNKQSTQEIKNALLAQYSQWKGTRYHWGGSTHSGVDCSALMQHIFNDSLHKQLPRTTFEQIKNGQRIDRSELKPGDLVFFQTHPGVRHVGVYLGNSEFMHASRSQGVTISSLANRYWVQHYETARRLTLTS
jgi:lipoprotein Spr